MDRSYSSACRIVLFTTSFAPLGTFAEEPRPKERVPSYSNQDLDRVHAQREQVGFASIPATAEGRQSTPAPAAHKSGEQFWRREADAHRGRIAVLQRALAELQDKATATRRPASSRGRKTAATSPPSFERRIAALQARIRDEDARFLDRARKEGALPGWLR